MNGLPSAKENLLIPGAATWTSRSGVVLGFDSLSMLTATRKPRGRVSPLLEQNRSDLETQCPVNSPLKRNYPSLPTNIRRSPYPESPLKKQDYSCSESPSKKLSELNLPKRDFLKAVNFDNLARAALSEEDDGPTYGGTPEKNYRRANQRRIGPAGDSNDERTGHGDLSRTELDASADMTEQQKAKEQTKLLDKFKQMRQLQLQQQDKLIQQQQEQLDALRVEQQRVQQMLAKQRDWKAGRNSQEASPACSPYTSPGQTQLKTTMMTHQVAEDSDHSEDEEVYGESYEYGSDKENIPIERVLHEQNEDDTLSDMSEEEDDGSVTVEGVVPFIDTASACSEMDEEPKQLYSSYEVETMVQVYSKQQKKTFKKAYAAPVDKFSDEDEEYRKDDQELVRDRRVETPSPQPCVEDSLSPPHAPGGIDDQPVVGAGKSFEQLLAEQLQLEERKEQLGIGYTPSPKGPRKKTFLRKGEGIARFTGPPPKLVRPKKTFTKKPVSSTSSASTATSVSTSTTSVTANKKNEAIKAPLKTLLLKPLQKLSQIKCPPPVQPAKVKSHAGNTSIDQSFQQRVEHMENNEKDEIDELEEFELLEKVADNFSFTSSDSSLAGKAKALEAANKASRYEELMKRLAMESSSDYSSESTDSEEEDEDEHENLEKTLIEERNASHVSSAVSTPRKMQRKIASRDAGMAVTERDVMPSDFKEPDGSELSESEEEDDDDDDQNTLIKHDEIGYRLSQQGDSPKKQTKNLDFDDEDSWGDFGRTPRDRANRDEVKETRPVVKTTSPIARDKADHVQVEKLKATEEDGMSATSASPPPVSNLMTKLFPTLKPPKPKPSVEELQNQAKLQAARQPEVAEGAVSKALREKLLEIEREIERFRTENAAVAKLKVEREEGLNKLKREMEEFEKQKDEELKNLQEFKEQELKKLKKEKKLFEKYRKEAQAIPDKKQRDEIEQLNQELSDLRDDLKKREQRWTSGTNRMRNRIEQLEKENAELKEEIRMLEKRRLDSWQKEQNSKNEQRSQLPIRKAIVQQVLPSTKDTTKPPTTKLERGQERNGQDRLQSNRNDPLRLSIQSEGEDGLSIGDDAQLNSTAIERIKSPFEDTPRGLVAMTIPSEVDKSFMGPAGQNSARKNQALISAITKIDKGDLDYEESRHKDGKVDRIYTNGAREIMYANGTRREISSDGKTIIVSFFNGDMKQIMPDQRVIYFYADAGTTHTTYPDGLEILQFPNLQIEKHYPDGTREITFPDQIIKYLFPNGSEESIFPDGTVIRVDKNGDRTVEFANGQREIHTQQFKKREYPDGTTKTVYPDGRQETRYSTGRVRVKDKHGNILVDQMSA